MREPFTPTERLRRLMRIESSDLRLIILFALVTDFLFLVTPVAVQSLVNTVAFATLLQPLVVLSLIVLVALALSAIFTAFEVVIVEMLQRRLFVRTANELALRFPKAEQSDEPGKRNLIYRFFELTKIQKTVSVLLVDGLAVGIQLVVGLVVLAFYHPLLLAFDALLVGSLSIVIFVFGRGAVKTSIKESKASYAVAEELERILSTKSPDLGEIETRCDDYIVYRRSHFRIVFGQTVGVLVIYALASASLLGLGGSLVMSGQLTLGQLIAAELILGLIAAGLLKLAKLFENYYDLLTSLHKIGEVLDVDPVVSEASTLDETRKKFISLADTPMWIRGVARKLGWLGLAGAVGLAVVPWQQSAYGTGRVIAYAPLERQQMITATLEGRVTKWFVREGSKVKKGDPIVQMSDIDPDIISRLEQERTAILMRKEAGEERAQAIDFRIAHLGDSRSLAVSAGSSRVQMAINRVRGAAQGLDAAEASMLTAELNLKRQKALAEKGLTSTRNVELAELEYAKAKTDIDRADAALDAARSEQIALKLEQQRFGTEGNASIQDARAAHKVALAEVASAKAELARIEVRLARQRTQAITAPRDGVILRLLVNPDAELVKPGEGVAVLVPNTDDRAVEMWVDGNDAPLITEGRRVRLQFEGWPAVQFSGWPSVAVGTFAGRVVLVDSTDNGDGQFRVVILPDNKKKQHWPSSRFLRQGVRANGWVLLNRVTLGYEIWRKINGFPPVITHAKSEPKEYSEPQSSKSSDTAGKDSRSRTTDKKK